MSFRDFEKLDIQKYLEKYGDITLGKLIEILEEEKILCIRYDGLGTIELRSKLYPIKCFRSKGTRIGKTLFENLDRCKNHIGKCTPFITRDGLDAIFCSNHGLKNQVLVYVDER